MNRSQILRLLRTLEKGHRHDDSNVICMTCVSINIRVLEFVQCTLVYNVKLCMYIKGSSMFKLDRNQKKL